MAEGKVTTVLSRQATNVANQMKESGIFPDAVSAAKFAMSYAIKYYWDEIGSISEISRLDGVYDQGGTTYGVGTVDPDNDLLPIIKVLYPTCRSPYTVARVLMCYGLNKLGDLLEEGRLFPISKVM